MGGWIGFVYLLSSHDRAIFYRYEKTGELFLADLGIPEQVYQGESLRLKYISPFGDRYRVPLSVEKTL
jgi:hypothetical protein